MPVILRERRRPSFDGELVMRTTVAWILVCVLLLATGAGAILSTRFPDPDDALRLIQVRDLIAGQSWFDLTQHRIDAAHGGVPMHWSRLVDLPLAAMLLLLTPIVGSSLAETITMVAVPLLTFGLALLLAGRIAWRVIGGEAATFACLALAMSVPVVGQLRPLRIDHHGWQIVLALAALNALMARSARTGGWIAGMALAAWLAISLEGLPMAAAFAGIAALRWLRNPADRSWLVHLMQGLAGGSLLLFFATRGLGDLAVHCDAIGPVHLTMFALASLILTVLGSARALPMVPTLAGFAVAGGGALAVLLTAAPHCATGTFDMLDPVVHRFWFDNVVEGMPVWRQDAGTALQTLLPPLIALWSTVKLMGNSQDWLRRWWCDYALLLAAALLLSVFVTRAGAVAGAFAAVPLGWQMREWIVAARRHRAVRRRVAALAGVGLALLPTLPLTLLGLAMPLRAASAAAAPRASSCSIAQAAPSLRALPPGDILAPLDIGPGLLLETRHSVVATGHHRAGPAIRTVIDSFAGDAAAAHRIIAERGIEYVALCPELAEPGLYRTAAPDGFAAQLSRGHVPDWLAPIAVPGGVDLKIWRVAR